MLRKSQHHSGVFLPAFKLAPVGDEHLFTVVPSVAIPHVSQEVLEDLCRTASDENDKAVDLVL